MISFLDYITLNEIFDYTPNYKEVNKNVYIENWVKFLNKQDPKILKQPGIDLERTVFENHGPRVHYYTYKDYLIFYGKFKHSNKYEIHFWDIKNLEYEDNVSKSGFNTVFSVIMSIIKDKHLKTNARLYLHHKTKERREFYKLIIDKILKKYELNWYCSIKEDDVIIHPEKELSESNKLPKPLYFKI